MAFEKLKRVDKYKKPSLQAVKKWI